MINLANKYSNLVNKTDSYLLIQQNKVITNKSYYLPRILSLSRTTLKPIKQIISLGKINLVLSSIVG